MKLRPLFALVTWLLFLFTTVAEAKPLELPAIQVVPIQDSATERQYELYIKLPDSYDNKSDKKYPVIYYTDAMWHVELLSSATAFIMEDTILVGISWQKDNKDLDITLKNERGEHVSRYRDYSMRPSTNPESQARGRFGQATQHLAFIRNDVIKHIEKSYRTDTENRTYFGYSLGGEFGAYTLLTQHDTFKNYILGSPSIDGEVPFLSELLSTATSKSEKLNANVFMSYGSLETEASTHIEEFFKLLDDQKGKSLSIKLAVVEGDHGSAFPGTGVQSVTWLSNLVNKGNKG